MTCSICGQTDSSVVFNPESVLMCQNCVAGETLDDELRARLIASVEPVAKPIRKTVKND